MIIHSYTYNYLIEHHIALTILSTVALAYHRLSYCGHLSRCAV